MSNRAKASRTYRDSLDNYVEILGSTQGSGAPIIFQSATSSRPAKRDAAASSARRNINGCVIARSHHTCSPKRSCHWFVIELFAASLFSGTNLRKWDFLSLVTIHSFYFQILRLYVICECTILFFTFWIPFHWNIIINYKADMDKSRLSESRLDKSRQ